MPTLGILTATLLIGCGGDSTSSTADTMVGSTTGTTTPGTTTGTTTGTTSATYDLDLAGVGYTSHVGETLYFILWNDADASAPVAVWTTDVNGEAEMSASQPGVLMSGRSYTIAYYSEHNMVDGCQPPPAADHGWTVAIPAVAGDQNLNIDHNTDFDLDVCDAFPACTTGTGTTTCATSM